MAEEQIKRPWHIPTADAAQTPIPEGRRSAELLRHGSLEVRYYAPEGTDPQTPHDRDEVYVIASGTGSFLRDQEIVRFSPGDMLFVPARMKHRFENFSAEFATWVFFYGPEGGEQDNPFV